MHSLTSVAVDVTASRFLVSSNSASSSEPLSLTAADSHSNVVLTLVAKMRAPLYLTPTAHCVCAHCVNFTQQNYCLQADSPRAKAVFALRNPVERAWSDYRFMLDIYQRKQISFPAAVARTLQPLQKVSRKRAHIHILQTSAV
jgi:hypothetical protein